METKEHLLIIELLAQQNLFLKQLCDALESNEAITKEEVRLFGAFLRAENAVTNKIVDQTRRLYLKEAQKLGVQTGLEVPPESL
jgi:hypothetical protein